MTYVASRRPTKRMHLKTMALLVISVVISAGFTCDRYTDRAR
jgi:hypothetical protein